MATITLTINDSVDTSEILDAFDRLFAGRSHIDLATGQVVEDYTKAAWAKRQLRLFVEDVTIRYKRLAIDAAADQQKSALKPPTVT